MAFFRIALLIQYVKEFKIYILLILYQQT